jgi:threonylcarbamoyladenosine tRNA methylthiotransferase CDKAL1
MRLRFEAYGCALNRGPAREPEELAANGGHATGTPEAGPDLVVLVTCTVVQPTEDRMLARLNVLGTRGKRVLVAVCMASAQAGFLVGAPLEP